MLSPELLGRGRLLMSTVSNARSTTLFTRMSTLYQAKVRGNLQCPISLREWQTRHTG